MGWPRFRGALLVDDAVEAAGYCDDFGRLVRRRPLAVLRAADLDDVILAVRHARTLGIRVVARGEGHTTRGQCQHDGALIIDLRALDRIAEPEPDRVRVGAGARWSSVVRRTFAAGLTPPVLTDFVELTVGGTLSVGGVGGQSFAHGLQVDNVVELVVVTGAGEAVRCSAAHEAELFHACLGGLGRFGIIVEATLRLVPAPRRVALHVLPYDELDTFLAAQHVIARAGAFDYLCGNFLPPSSPSRGAAGWQLELQCVRDATATLELDLAGTGARLDRAPPPRELDYLELVQRLDTMVDAWRASGGWTAHHPWIDLFVPRAGAAELIAIGLDELDRAGLSEGYVMTYPLQRHRHGDALPCLPDGEELFLFDILPTVMRSDRSRLVAMEARCERLLQVAFDRGATIYPIGYPIGAGVLGGSLWDRLHGKRGPSLQALRERHDPDGICGAELD